MPNRKIWRTVGAMTIAAGLGVLPGAAFGASDEVALGPSVEAWYQTDPTCDLPAGCVADQVPVGAPVALPNAYPARTMHVATSAGQTTAVTYVTFNLLEITGEIVGGRLEIPLDVDPANGSLLPEESQVAVCPFIGVIQAADGNLKTPPDAVCSDEVLLEYASKPEPHLQGDISAVATSLALSDGLALIPNPSLSESETPPSWRVVFSAKDREDEAATPPLQLTLSVRDEDADDEAVTDDEEQPEADGSGSVIVGSSGSAGGASGSLSGLGAPGGGEPVESSASAPTAEIPAAAPELVEAAQAITWPYPYPARWLLPVVALVAIPLIGSALVRDLSPRDVTLPRA